MIRNQVFHFNQNQKVPISIPRETSYRQYKLYTAANLKNFMIYVYKAPL